MANAAIDLPHGYKPHWYQVPIYEHFVPNCTRKRAIVIAHRRYGKDMLAINITAPLTQQRIGTYWHVLPFAKQARAVVWNGMTTPSEEDEKKGAEPRPFQSFFPDQIVERRNENEMRLHLKNGSIWQAIGGDDIDRHVGTNPIGVVLSEFALMDPRVYDYIRPILRQNRGWCLMITTIRGKNIAYKMLKKAEVLQRNDPNWLAIDHPVNFTNAFTEADIEAERREGMSEQLIKQEYYNDPSAPIVGAYYVNELMKVSNEGRILPIPYDPKLPVSTAWDLGYGDATVVLFYQTIGHEIRIIDCYANSGEEMGHYANILRTKEYNYEHHAAPWDAEIKQLAAGGKSIYDVAKSLGIRFKVMPQPRTVADGIEQVRNTFPSLWFDKKNCERLLEALGSYRKQPLDDKYQYSGENGEMVFKDAPVHDWTSHYADALRTLAWSVRKNHKLKVNAPQIKAEDDYNYV
jgi:phage terminase large subunit